MAGTAAKLRNRNETPVWMFWQFGDEGGIVPRLSIDHEEAREDILDIYDADSVEDLEDALLPNSHTVDKLRLGVLLGEKGDAEFHTETDLLVSVEGIGDELATGLLDECRDIPTICERRRRNGDVFLGDLRHDAEVQDHDWVDELDSLIDDFGDRDNLERRMKDAGVWAEPENEVADY